MMHRNFNEHRSTPSHERVLLALVFALTLPALLVAQRKTNDWSMFPDPDNHRNASVFSSRSDNVRVAGEVLQEVGNQLVRGIGDMGQTKSDAKIHYFRHFLQDQNAATQQSYNVLLRKSDKTGKAPDPTSAGIIYKSGTLKTPKGTGLQSWQATHTPKTPVAVTLLPIIAFYMALYIDAALFWPSDGLSTHVAHDTLGSRGDNPRSNARKTIADIRGGRVYFPKESVSYAWTLGILAPVLLAGGLDRRNFRQVPTGSINFGRGGYFPDVLSYLFSFRYDDLAAQIRAVNQARGIALMIVATQYLTNPLYNPLWRGGLQVDPRNALFMPPVILNAVGRAQILLALGANNANTRKLLARVNLFAQVLVFDAALRSAYMTNAIQWQTKQ